MKRRDVRELVFKALFAYDFESSGDPFRLLDYIAGDLEMAGMKKGGRAAILSVAENEYARRLISGIMDNKDELDALISKYSIDWQIERLGVGERNVLRIGFYEMLYDEKLPPAIAINEALELIKKYGADDAAGFVNGILDKKTAELS